MLATDDQLMRPVKVIKLTQGQCTIVDPEDYERASRKLWHIVFKGETRQPYAAHSEKKGSRKYELTLHKFLTGWPYVDHINRDSLDNRRSNLRQVTHAQNQYNQRGSRYSTSPYKGVSWDKARHKWCAQIMIDYHQNHLGRFDNEIDAAKAYDKAALAAFGEYAYLNFPRERNQAA